MISYWVWWAISGAARILPKRLTYALARVVGIVVFYTWPQARRTTVRNFRVVLGADASEQAVRQVARHSVVNYCRYLADFSCFPRMSNEEIGALVDDDGVFERLARLRSDGRGVVVASMHFGNWDAGAFAAAARGLPLTVVAESFGHEKLDAAVLGVRERHGMQIALMRGGAVTMYRALTRGRFLAVVVDRPTPGEGVPVTFFGKETRVPAGAARLALGTGAQVVAAACYRKTPNRPPLHVWADFDIRRPADPRSPEAPRELMQAIFSAHEHIIRRRPGQWYMFRDMWPEHGEK